MLNGYCGGDHEAALPASCEVLSSLTSRFDSNSAAMFLFNILGFAAIERVSRHTGVSKSPRV
jgi:hypothetical protein